MIKKLIEIIRNHKGEFHCEAIGAEDNKKIVKFSHTIEAPAKDFEKPNIGDLNEFYSLVGSLTLYSCPEFFEAGYFLAPPSEWGALEEDLSDWTDMVDEDEEDEAFPSWFGSHKVIGEIPGTGNYILVVEAGSEVGAIYTFDHDGFEFRKVGSSLEEFVLKTMDPSPDAFVDLVSHMRFTSDDSEYQWWARELHHNTGKVIKNNA